MSLSLFLGLASSNRNKRTKKKEKENTFSIEGNKKVGEDERIDLAKESAPEGLGVILSVRFIHRPMMV